MQSFIVQKSLNNNVIIASGENEQEVVLIGKGIGFQRTKGDVLTEEQVEKVFVLTDKKEQEQFKLLLPHIPEETIAAIHEAIVYIETKCSGQLNEHIHIALTDHISFAIKRLEQGIDFKNPFLTETKTLYPEEFNIAETVVAMINEKLNVQLPPGEIGFVALHIHSALSKTSIAEVNQSSSLVGQLILTIEQQLNMQIDKESINYLRLVRHLHYAIQRVKSGEVVEEPVKLKEVLQQEYPLCYNLAWKLIKIMQHSLKKPVYDAEAVYLTLHLQRLTNYTDM